MKACHIFDMDGTLVDSFHAVFRAYQVNGITMPLGVWGRPWRQWLPQQLGNDLEVAERVHLAKNETYLGAECQALIRPLPLATVLRQLHGRASIATWVVTGASNEAARHVLKNIVGVALESEQTYGVHLRTGADLEAKKLAAIEAATLHEGGLFYEDDRETCDQLALQYGRHKIDHNWSVCHVR